jgi:UDP-N-acetylmuramyl pentapeptide phosphotransferase/UDP-N-acetylglucosamine-1-phosphate transferase
LSLVGLVDDLRPLPASVRFGLQIVIAVSFVWLAAPTTFILVPGCSLLFPRTVVVLVLVLWTVGVLNIYNFMDGMDGLAGTQSVFASVAFALVLAAAGARDAAFFCVLLAAGSSGFLMHNFPPASIFMGDVGSTFIGLSLAALAVVGMGHGVPLAVTALALSPFLLDGTFTT